jgi:hypothetical protein
MNLRDIERLTKTPIPVMAHKFGLAAPEPGARLEKRAPRGRQRPLQHKASHVREDRPRGGEAKRKDAPAHHRDQGDRRDRKGNAVWSNRPAPKRNGRNSRKRPVDRPR